MGAIPLIRGQNKNNITIIYAAAILIRTKYACVAMSLFIENTSGMQLLTTTTLLPCECNRDQPQSIRIQNRVRIRIAVLV